MSPWLFILWIQGSSDVTPSPSLRGSYLSLASVLSWSKTESARTHSSKRRQWNKFLFVTSYWLIRTTKKPFKCIQAITKIHLFFSFQKTLWAWKASTVTYYLFKTFILSEVCLAVVWEIILWARGVKEVLIKFSQFSVQKSWKKVLPCCTSFVLWFRRRWQKKKMMGNVVKWKSFVSSHLFT